MENNPKIQYLFIINPISGTAQKENIPELIYRTLKVEKERIKIVLTRGAEYLSANLYREHKNELILQGRNFSYCACRETSNKIIT